MTVTDLMKVVGIDRATGMDAIPVNINGVEYTPVHKDDQQSTQQTDKALWTPASGKKFALTDLIISVDTAMTVTVKDGTATIYEFYLAANGGAVINLKTPYVSSAADNVLKYSTSTAGKISISVEGYEV